MTYDGRGRCGKPISLKVQSRIFNDVSERLLQRAAIVNDLRNHVFSKTHFFDRLRCVVSTSIDANGRIGDLTAWNL